MKAESLDKTSKENESYVELKTQIYVLEKKFLDSEVNKSKEIRELKRKIDSLNTDSCIFSFLIEKSLDFLSSKNELKSQIFYCGKLPWSILVKSLNTVGNQKYLEIFLQLETKDIKDDIWIKIDCEFRLLNPSSDSKVIRLFKNKNFSNTRSILGYPEFIDYNELVDYVRNDCIKLEISLKVVNVL